MNSIHPTAIVNKKAELGNNITILPYAIVEENVVIGDDCTIGPHAVIYNGARIGNHVYIHQGASIANVPQDLKFDNDESILIIDDNTVIREFAALHRGTKETGRSKVGKNCLIMAYAHVAHDCEVGDYCILSNSVQVAGHCVIENNVTIGGISGVHQFSQIGQHSMIGACILVTQDVPPYLLIGRDKNKYTGINVVGLRRRGFSTDDILILKKAYGYLYDNSLNVSQAREKIISELGDNKLVKNVLDFLSRSKRGITGK